MSEWRNILSDVSIQLINGKQAITNLERTVELIKAINNIISW